MVPNKSRGYYDNMMIPGMVEGYYDEMMIPNKVRRWLWWYVYTSEGERTMIDVSIITSIGSSSAITLYGKIYINYSNVYNIDIRDTDNGFLGIKVQSGVIVHLILKIWLVVHIYYEVNNDLWIIEPLQ